jgi:hypothetical protein
MVLQRINNWLVIFVIICSTSIYKFAGLGKVDTAAVLLGSVVIVAALILSSVYSEQKSERKHFIIPVVLILISIVTSMTMANYSRDQSFGQTFVAQRALYYYLFYLLLHQLRVKIEDIEKIIIAFGIVYVLFFLVQYFLYPRIIFDAYVRSNRGTIRIYLPGADYLFISFYLSIQYVFRTNRFRYMLLALLIAVVFVLTGGRQSMATVVLVVVMFLLFDRKVKSRFTIILFGIVGALAIFIIFQGIFEALFLQSRGDIRLGENYIRIQAMEYYLTDFFKSPVAYLTGNGMYNFDSSYGREISYNMVHRQFYLADIGLVGNYAIYGLFFVFGVLGLIARALTIKIESRYTYIKLMFITMAISIIIAGGFASPDTICAVVLMIYMLDISHSNVLEKSIHDV